MTCASPLVYRFSTVHPPPTPFSKAIYRHLPHRRPAQADTVQLGLQPGPGPPKRGVPNAQMLTNPGQKCLLLEKTLKCLRSAAADVQRSLSALSKVWPMKSSNGISRRRAPGSPLFWSAVVLRASVSEREASKVYVSSGLKVLFRSPRATPRVCTLKPGSDRDLLASGV